MFSRAAGLFLCEGLASRGLEDAAWRPYPASFLANEWLGDMIGKIRAGDPSHPGQALYDELDQINGYASQYNHGKDMGDLMPDQIDSVELTGYVRRTLRVVNALQAQSGAPRPR
jgi:hypothetical protein